VQHLDVYVRECNHVHVLAEPRWSVHVPHPGVGHPDVEVHLPVCRPRDQLDSVGEIEATLRLDDVGELPDDVAVLAVQRELHLGLVVLQILGAHLVLLLECACAARRTLAYDMRWMSLGPSCSTSLSGTGWPFPLSAAKRLPGTLESRSTIIRSRVTFARTLAAAMDASSASPPITAVDWHPSPSTAKPSVRTNPGRGSSAATERRMPSRLHRWMPRWSIRSGSITTTADATAWRRTASWRRSRTAAVRFLESSRSASVA